MQAVALQNGHVRPIVPLAGAVGGQVFELFHAGQQVFVRGAQQRNAVAEQAFVQRNADGVQLGFPLQRGHAPHQVDAFAAHDAVQGCALR